VRVYVATKNAGKLAEMQALFAGGPLELTTFADYQDPVEGDTSYTENAALKAHALHSQLKRAGMDANVLADDSGLEVFALDGRPGVVTAYYGGVDATWAQRRALLLKELVAQSDRRARFVSALHFIAADGREQASFGSVDGVIAREERGAAGFSFDPVFVYPPAEKTFAELSLAEKNRVSHRAQAARALLEALRG